MASLTKKKIISDLLRWAGKKGAARAQWKAKMEAIPYNDLRKKHAAAKERMAAQKGKPAPKAKAKATRKSRPKISKAVKSRAGKIVRAIKAGRIEAKRYAQPADAPGANARERYANFLAQYKGVRISRKSRKAAAPTMKSVYGQIAGKKQPYYLSKGYHVRAFNVGGGPRGPGVVRRMAGSNVKPFWELTEAQRKKVCTFLNGPGKHLRTKGAPGKCSVAGLGRTRQQKAAKKATSGKGSSNWW